MKGILRDVRDELLGGEGEETGEARVLGFKAGFLEIVICYSVGDLRGSNAERSSRASQ